MGKRFQTGDVKSGKAKIVFTEASRSVSPTNFFGPKQERIEVIFIFEKRDGKWYKSKEVGSGLEKELGQKKSEKLEKFLKKAKVGKMKASEIEEIEDIAEE